MTQGDFERREKVKALRASLKQDPTNLELADRYWNAVRCECGGAVRDAYRDAAVASSLGAAAFARAYRELFLHSGEGPYIAAFDELLIQALNTYLPQLTGEDRANVEWMLHEIVYARITIRSSRFTEACFEWLDFDGDDCFRNFRITVIGGPGIHNFDLGPCAVNGLRKVSRFFRDRQEASVRGGFRHPDERYYAVHRTADGYNLVVRFEGSDLNKQFSIPCERVYFDDEFPRVYSR